jgi:hypothetical protein
MRPAVSLDDTGRRHDVVVQEQHDFVAGEAQDHVAGSSPAASLLLCDPHRESKCGAFDLASFARRWSVEDDEYLRRLIVANGRFQ